MDFSQWKSSSRLSGILVLDKVHRQQADLPRKFHNQLSYSIEFRFWNVIDFDMSINLIVYDRSTELEPSPLVKEFFVYSGCSCGSIASKGKRDGLGILAE